MSNHQLKREEAIQLITPVADGEAAEDQNRAFFSYIQHDNEVKKRFEEEKWIKYLVRYRLPRYEAPNRLRQKIKQFIIGTAY